MMTDQNNMNDDDRRNLIIFIIAAIAVWLSFDHFLLQPRLDALQAAQKQEAQQKAQIADGTLTPVAPPRPRADVLKDSARVDISNRAFTGSVSLRGGRLDDLTLNGFYKTHDRVDAVELLSPAGSDHPKYAEFGWLSADKTVRVPDKDSVWQVSSAAGAPLTLYWDNGAGLRFEKTIYFDDEFHFTVAQKIINSSGSPVTLYPYAILAEHGLPPDLFASSVIHEGPIGYIGGELIEHSYKKIKKQKLEDMTATGGWIAITQNYWLTALMPDQTEESRFRFVYTPAKMPGDREKYQVDVMGAARSIAPGESSESTIHAYLGAKKENLLERYERELGIAHLDLAIDYGMYYFLTKPFHRILVFMGEKTGNFGIGIIILTIIVRLCVFPLASASYKSFARLKQISPKMHELREKFGDNKEKLQEELVKLYEKEKVNPMAGCLPILIQIPIFFALFKVLQISIEMRHAPFYGWITDLAAPDPTSIFNLFGLIPWTPPSFMMIGAWPCLMLVFMIIQKKMNPPPQDKTQAMMINFMPFFITYILSQFAAGLVIYWTFSNALSVLQQYVIMRRMGVEVHWFKKPEDEKKMEKEVADGPTVHPELTVLEHKAEEALFGSGDSSDGKNITPPKGRRKKKK